MQSISSPNCIILYKYTLCQSCSNVRKWGTRTFASGHFSWYMSASTTLERRDEVMLLTLHTSAAVYFF
jgi:hypothetical protein